MCCAKIAAQRQNGRNCDIKAALDLIYLNQKYYERQLSHIFIDPLKMDFCSVKFTHLLNHIVYIFTHEMIHEHKERLTLALVNLINNLID